MQVLISDDRTLFKANYFYIDIYFKDFKTIGDKETVIIGNPPPQPQH